MQEHGNEPQATTSFMQQSVFETWWHTVTHGRESEGETGEWSG